MSTKHKYYYFTLNVSYHDCQAIYLQPVPNSVIRAESGQRIQVPTSRLRQCIENDGLKGRYQLTVDNNNKILDFKKLR